MQFNEVLYFGRETGYAVTLDSREVFPDDPGNGTPAMVKSPSGASSTLWCAADTGGLLADDDSVEEIPLRVLDWLQGPACDHANDFITAVALLKKPIPDRDREIVSRLVQFWTAFDSLDALLNAEGGYRPSLDMQQAIMAAIADTYDMEQSKRGDPRRAYRYGRECGNVT